MKTWILGALMIALVAATAAAAPPSPGKLTPPDAIELLQGGVDPAWTGVWDVRVALLDCETGFEFFAQTVRDTLCPAEGVEPTDLDGVEDFECSGTYTATTIDLSCLGMFEILPGCNATYDYQYDGVLSGDSYTVDVYLNATYEGEGCEGLEASCTRTRLVGTRVGPAPVGACEVPVEPTTWSTLKARY